MQDTRWVGGYPSPEVQSVYSTAPADWIISILVSKYMFAFLQFWKWFFLILSVLYTYQSPVIDSYRKII